MSTRRLDPVAPRGICGLVALGLIVAITGCSPSVSKRYGLEPLPQVDSTPFEEAVSLQLGRAEGALDNLLRGNPDGPALALAYGELGQLYQVYELYQAAEAAYRNALRIAPEDPRWLHYLGVVLQTSGQLEEAAARFRQVLDRRPDDLPARVRLGQTLFDDGQTAAASAELERALGLDPDCALAHYFLGRLVLSEGDAARAVEHFERALAIQPRADRLHYHLAQAYRRLGNTARAERHARLVGDNEVWLEDPLIDALRPLEAGAAAHIRRAAAAQIDGHAEAALEEYRQAVEADPSNPEARQGLGGMLAQKGDVDGAIAELEKALSLDPGSPRIHFNLGGLLALRGELEPAIEHYETTLRIDPRFRAAQLAYARLLSDAGRLAEAEARYHRWLELEPGSVEARLGLGSLLAGQGRLDEASGQIRAALELDLTEGERAHVLNRQAGLEIARGYPRRAEELYRQAIATAPGEAEGFFGLANLLGSEGRYREAAAAFRQAAASEPGNRQIRLGESTALVLAGAWLEAREKLEAAIAILGDDPDLALALARILATSPDARARDGGRAVELAQRAHDREGTLESAEVLAMALAEQGSFDQAADWQRQVVAKLETLGQQELTASAARRLEDYLARRPVRGMP